MRIFILIAVLSSMVFSASKATKPYTFTPHTTSSADQVNKNFDSLYVPFNKAIDTLNKVVPRWSSMLYQKDSTWKWMKIDTIRGNPHIDSIAGSVVMDTITDLDSIYSDVVKTTKIVVGSPPSTEAPATIWGNANSASGELEVNPGNNTDVSSISCRHWTTSRQYGIKMFSDPVNLLGGLSLSGSVNNFVLNIGSQKMKVDNSGKVYFGKDIYDTGMVACSNVLTNYIQFGTAANSKDSIYIDTTFKDTLFKYTTPPDAYTFLSYTSSARIVQSGAVVTLYQPALQGTLTGSEYAVLGGIPYKFCPANETSVMAFLYSNSASIAGVIKINFDGNGRCLLLKPDGTSLANGSSGFAGNVIIQWIK
jgi:hypothetical protein